MLGEYLLIFCVWFASNFVPQEPHCVVLTLRAFDYFAPGVVRVTVGSDDAKDEFLRAEKDIDAIDSKLREAINKWKEANK